jgi:glycosyltransferase involved in cell wall biosynthesis
VGLVLVPAGLVALFLTRREALLWLTVAFAPFSATAILNFQSPSFGVQPGYYFGALLALRVVTESLSGRGLHVDGERRKAATPFLLFLGAAILSVALIPIHGADVQVVRPSGETELLRLTAENVRQLLYLVYVVGLALIIGTCGLGPGEMKTALRVFVASATFVALWGWLQLAMHYVGIAYPSYLFNNNASFAQHYDQVLNVLHLKRMSSVAPEPSMLARFLLVPSFMLLYAVYHDVHWFAPSRLTLGLSIFFLVTLLLTTSSTAVAGLILGLAVLVAIEAFRRRRGAEGPTPSRRRSIRVTLLLIVSVPVVVLVVSIFWLHLDLHGLRQLVDVVLLDKLESSSGQGRVEGALHGLALFRRYPLLGVGWGSNRTFDLLTTLLAATGVLGAASFLWAHFHLLRRAYRRAAALDAARAPDSGHVLRILAIGLIMVLVGKALAEPDLIQLDHWILVGLLLAGVGPFTMASLEGGTPKADSLDAERAAPHVPIHRPMRLAVNGKPYALRNRTGASRVALNIIHNLAELRPQAAIDVFVPTTDGDAGLEELPPNVRVRPGRSRLYASGLGRSAWEQLVLPLQLRRGGPYDALLNLTNSMPIILAGTLPKLLLVHDIGFRDRRWFSRAFSWYLDLVLRRAARSKTTHFVAVSQSAARQVQATFAPVNGVEVIYNDSDDPPVDVAPTRTDRPYVLFLGSINPRKNVAGAIRGFRSFAGRVQGSVDLVVIGDTNPIFAGQELETAGDDVRFVGYVSDLERWSLLKGARLLLLPSFLEGFGLPILEALKVGTPVVASDIPVFHELFEDAVEYVDPASHEDIARGVLDVYIDPARRQRLIARGSEVACRFSWRRSAAAYLELLERIVRREP